MPTDSFSSSVNCFPVVPLGSSVVDSSLFTVSTELLLYDIAYAMPIATATAIIMPMANFLFNEDQLPFHFFAYKHG